MKLKKDNPNKKTKKPSPQNVKIHPISWRELKKGHPWIIKDDYTSKFAQSSQFLKAIHEKDEAILLNDPLHPKIKARFWTTENTKEWKNHKFNFELKLRIKNAFEQRIDSEILNQRDNCYLLFGEGDLVPGLFILKLGHSIIIQYNSFFWTPFIKEISSLIQEYNQQFNINKIWVHKRVNSKDHSISQISPTNQNKVHDFVMEEYGIKYNIQLGKLYDYGIYTDMSSIRDKLKTEFSTSQRVLNLYSYTGAFSLFALKQGAKDVVSVDLSSRYIDWLEKNLSINTFTGNHTSLTMPVNQSLDKLHSEKQVFDLIICDPPSFSTTKSTYQKSINDYEGIIKKALNILSSKGTFIFFLNTHSISPNKFQNKIALELKKYPIKFKFSKNLKLSQDCPTLRGFKEGNYLKGLVIQIQKD